MQGNASWEQILFLSGVIVAVGVAAFVASWRIQVYLGQHRDEIEKRVDLLIDSLEARIRALENSNAGTLVVLDHVEIFRQEVQQQYQDLRAERQADMEGIHRRLDAMHNVARLMGVQIKGNT